MKTKIYKTIYDGEIIVEECTRKEFIELAKDFVDNMDWCESLGIENDDTLYIDYKDGRSFSYYQWLGTDGKFMVSNIDFGVISNSCTYQVTGAYEIDENGILERA